MRIPAFPRLILPALAAGLLPISLATAQEAVTTPVGVMTYTFPATTQLTGTYISVPLTASPVFSGSVATVGANSLTFSGTPFTAGALSQASAPHFVRFQSGAQIGRIILVTANTANSVTVDVTDNSTQTTNLNTSGFAVAEGDRVQIIPGDTLASFFGDNTPQNPLVFAGAAAPLSADTISVFNKATSRYDSYFFSTSLGYWRPATSSTQNVNSLILYPESGVGITRRNGRPATQISVVGEVPTIPSLTKTVGGNQGINSSTRVPVDMTLGQLNIANWIKSNAPLSADSLSIFNPTTARWDSYYQRVDGTWRRNGGPNTDQSSVVISAGSTVGILKRGVVSGQASFISVPLPYTL